MNGLGIFAIVNEGNDLISINNDYNIGIVTTHTEPEYLKRIFIEYYEKNKDDKDISTRSRKVSLDMFSSSSACNQILSIFEYKH